MFLLCFQTQHGWAKKPVINKKPIVKKKNVTRKMSPDKLLKAKLDSVIDILKKKDIDKEAKSKQIMKVVAPIIDFSLMAKLSLGKIFWRRMTTKQQAEFVRLFTENLRISYKEKLLLYEGQKIVYKTVAYDKRKRKCKVPTEIVSDNKQKLSIVFKFARLTDMWKIYDVEIQGVSLVRSYNSQFKEILKKGSYKDLFRKLKEMKEQADKELLKEKSGQKKSGSDNKKKDKTTTPSGKSK